MKDLLLDYIQNNFIDAETLSELSENMTAYEIETLWQTMKDMEIDTDANLWDLNKYR